MILDKIEHRASYAALPGLGELLDWLAAQSAAQFPAARTELRGEALYVNPVQLTTKAEEDCFFEAHRLYADVHYILKGCEVIVVEDIAAVRQTSAYEEGRDAGFYTAPGGTRCTLHPGDFLVCFPQDAHKVAVAPAAGPAPVKKLVGKLRLG